MSTTFSIAKALVVLVLELSLLSFTVLSEDINALPPLPPPHHHLLTSPATAPAPHHPGGHHHHHHLSPATAPAPHHHGGHHHHAHSPSTVHPPAHSPTLPKPKPPVQPPVKPPVRPKPPVQPPVKPPVRPKPPVPPVVPRSLVSVQGVVYCKSCKFAGVETLLGASPLHGATVKLQCNNTKYKTEANAVTDKNGYFFLEAPKTITSYGAHKCRVGLVSSTNATCNKPSDLHGGITGGVLRPEKAYFVNKVPFILYSVGPFAFEPKCPH